MRLERSTIAVLLLLFVATVAHSYEDSVAAVPAQTSSSTITTRARDQGLLRQSSMKHLKIASAGAQEETPSSSWSTRARELFGGGGDEEEDDPVSTAWIPGVFGKTLTE
jgi:hypothetical protein